MKSRQAHSPCAKAGRLFVTCSEAETESLGSALASELPVPAVVLLRGALGAGKTTLVRGMAAGLGLEDRAAVGSPSYTIVNVYQGRVPIYHVDLYRLEGRRDIRSVGLEDFIGRKGVTIVEWSERLPEESEATLKIEIVDEGDERRSIRVTRAGDMASGARSRHPRAVRPGHRHMRRQG